jgi:hypothetical protein
MVDAERAGLSRTRLVPVLIGSSGAARWDGKRNADGLLRPWLKLRWLGVMERHGGAGGRG